jgi:hypothetical protein
MEPDRYTAILLLKIVWQQPILANKHYRNFFLMTLRPLARFEVQSVSSGEFRCCPGFVRHFDDRYAAQRRSEGQCDDGDIRLWPLGSRWPAAGTGGVLGAHRWERGRLVALASVFVPRELRQRGPAATASTNAVIQLYPLCTQFCCAR